MIGNIVIPSRAQQPRVSVDVVARALSEGTAGTFKVVGKVLSLAPTSSDYFNPEFGASGRYGPSEQDSVNVCYWRLPAARALFNRKYLTASEYHALDDAGLEQLLAATQGATFIADIRVSQSSFDNKWEAHINKIYRVEA
jgi:hypothetical protein